MTIDTEAMRWAAPILLEVTMHLGDIMCSSPRDYFYLALSASDVPWEAGTPRRGGTSSK